MEARDRSYFREIDDKNHQQLVLIAEKENPESDTDNCLRCKNTISTDSCFEGNKEVSDRQLHCCDSDGALAQKAKEAIVESLRLSGVPVSNPDGIQLGHLDNSGPMGHTPEELGLCEMKTLAPCNKDGIVNSAHIEFPQTILSLQ